MKIAIGTDHAGYRYKEKIKSFLTTSGHEVQDFGTFSDESCDYPDFIFPVAKAVAAGEFERGIVLGGSGNGEAIAANKVKGIRCAVCWNTLSAEMARRHNDANVLSLGERMIYEDQLEAIVRIWLETPFDGGRHARRVDKIEPQS
ncbi:ribose-5-phosphate isomerase [Maritalea myrionectae]|uniref:Ribose-5-phosphate isomerase n=1 Tax=Maritalea myrionectae TaxID=454601 RepID=A0A2R4M9E9_9HYPH|nr:ribose 5-phosphate isomerase B [Maritalea myrionectae]AVX02651.1 ribose-5-phosphate isomerase [Maritalea myrionectae]